MLVIAGFATSFFALRWEYKQRGIADAPVVVLIAKGTRSLEIGRQLQAAGVIHAAWSFALAEHLYPGKALKAGEYSFPPHASLAGAITQMRAGMVILHRLTIPEGLTNLQIRTLIEAEQALTGPIGTLPPEGRLMPDTYSFTRGDSRASVIQRLHEAQARVLADAWQARDKAVTLKTPAQALILASIVEKETGVPDERARVAAVFYNRLARNIPLQTDPTLIYQLSHETGVLGRPLGHHDLGLVSPYNSYINQGLPPGPICNPGRAAIEAALHPASDDYLYFVATGEGGHAFASTLEEHNRNVARYVKVMREREGK